jgi:hypothetical protein
MGLRLKPAKTRITHTLDNLSTGQKMMLNCGHS